MADHWTLLFSQEMKPALTLKTVKVNSPRHLVPNRQFRNRTWEALT